MTDGTAPVIAETFYCKNSKIWHGQKTTSRFGPKDSIGSAVLEAMRKYPDNIIQVRLLDIQYNTPKETSYYKGDGFVFKDMSF